MWLDLAIAMSCGGAGLVCGWIMHAIGGFGNGKLVQQAASSIVNRDPDGDPGRERISEVAERLRGYAISMAADVDAHQTRVQAVNNTLSDDNASTPEQVFTAVNQLIEANEQMQAQLQSAQDRIHDQAVQIESAERRAQTDALTRVPNRGAFDSHLAKRYALGAGKAGTLALLDVDHFKQFNDVYGHRAGDEVLRIVAKVLHARLHPYGLVARFGGEEFAVIIDGRSVEQCKELIESRGSQSVNEISNSRTSDSASPRRRESRNWRPVIRSRIGCSEPTMRCIGQKTLAEIAVTGWTDANRFESSCTKIRSSPSRGMSPRNRPSDQQ